MKLVVPRLVFRRRRALAVVLLAGAAVPVAASLATAPGAGSLRPRSIDAAVAEVWSARQPIQRGIALAPLEERGADVPVRALVQDVHGEPVAGAVVEIWADGRGCVDRSRGNGQGMRGDVIDAPEGQVVWRSAYGKTGADGVLRLQVPVGMTTHIIAYDRSGRRAVVRAQEAELGYWDCFAPCGGVGGCGTCTSLPCTWPRHAGDCGRRVRDVVLRLAPPARVTGRVVDARGRPVAGARVATLTDTLSFDEDDDGYGDELAARGSLMAAPWAQPLDEWSRVAPAPPHQRPVVTGKDGRFALDIVEWRPFVVAAAWRGHHVGLSPPTSVRPGSRVDFQVELRWSQHLDLHVVDDAGRPVAGARVALDDDLHWDGQDARTDRNGRIVLDGLADGAQELTIDAEGYLRFEGTVVPGRRPVTVRVPRVPHVMIDVSAPLELLERLGDFPLLEIQLIRPGESLHGPETEYTLSAAEISRYRAMSDAERTHYHSARIDRLMDEFEDRMSRTETVEIGRDGHGRVAIEGLAPGEYTVCVSAPGEGSCGPTVQPSKRPRAVRLRLAADGPIASWD